MEEKRKGNVQEVKEAMAAGVCAVHCLEAAKKKELRKFILESNEMTELAAQLNFDSAK